MGMSCGVQAKTGSSKAYSTIALKKYLEQFPDTFDIDSEDKVL